MNRQSFKKYAAILPLCAHMALLSGCGQRGPLYLEEPPSASKPSANTPSQRPANSNAGANGSTPGSTKP